MKINVPAELLEKIFLDCPADKIEELQEAFERIGNDNVTNLEFFCSTSKNKSYYRGLIPDDYLNIKFKLLHSTYYKYTDSSWSSTTGGKLKEIHSIIIKKSYQTRDIEKSLNNSIKKDLIKKRKEKEKEVIAKDMAQRARANGPIERPNIKIPDIPFITRDTLEWQDSFKFQAKMAEREYQEDLKFRDIYRIEKNTIERFNSIKNIDINKTQMQELFTFARGKSQIIYNSLNRISNDSTEGLKVSLYHSDLINDKEEVGIKFTLNDKATKVFAKSLNSFDSDFTKNKFSAIVSLLNEKSELIVEIRTNLNKVYKEVVKKEEIPLRLRLRDSAEFFFNLEYDKTKANLSEKELNDLFMNSTQDPHKIYSAFEQLYKTTFYDMPMSIYTKNCPNGDIEKGINFTLQNRFNKWYYYTLKSSASEEEKADAIAKVLIKYSNKLKEIRDELLDKL